MFDDPQIKKAYEYALLAHHGQKRLSGEDFITHPVEVAKILQSWNVDRDTVIAGLLHDAVEDGGAGPEDILAEFGDEIAFLVDGVTKVGSLKLRGSEDEKFIENLRKMLLAMAKDLRVVLIKLADRLHNMRTLNYLSESKQKRIAKETLEIYAPLAERMGMGKIKGELEDLAFAYVQPEDFKWLKKYSGPYFKKSESIIEKIRRKLLSELTNTGIKDFSLSARAKHMYSLYTKLLRPETDRDLTKVHDLFALRVIVINIEECYLVLGLIHKIYRPVPYLGIRDHIANPKPNGYRSIHTNIFGPDGNIVEIQMRTAEMHDQAEMGVAAHWQYSQIKAHGVSGEKLNNIAKINDDKLSWVKQLVSWQNEVSDSKEYLDALKFDAFAQRNFVFSPKGDVYDLPNGATPIDFAYAVHTKLGHQASGAKVNGKLMPLHHKLNNGDVIEIVVDRKRTKPSHEWLDFVITTHARHAIAKVLKN